MTLKAATKALRISLIKQLSAQSTKDRIFDSDTVLCMKRLELIHTILLSLEGNDQKDQCRAFLKVLARLDSEDEKILNYYKQQLVKEITQLSIK